MENTKSNTSITSVIDDAGQTHAPSSLGVGTDPVDMGDLSNSPSSLSEPTPTQFVSAPEGSPMKRFFKRTDVIVGVILLLSIVGVVLFSTRSNSEQKALQTDISKEYKTVQVPLAGFVFNEDTVTFGSNKVVINGPLTLNEGMVISPSVQPNSPTAGQLYFDQNTNQLAYYNGTAFVPLTANGQVVQSLGGASGQVTVGGGLTIVGNQLSNAGVVSFGGQTGTITVGTGLRMIDNAIQNAGLLSLVAGTANLQIANDGNGNATISSVGGGSGTVTSPGGTAGQLALFNGAQDIGDSIVSQSGGAITVTGGLNVSGAVSFTNQLTVGNGGTGASSLATNGVLVGNGGSAISSVTTGTPGLCLVSTAGAPAFASCSGTLGVTSLNGLTGALTIANATGLGSTITISDATNSGIKGIASYNATNFSVASGLVNTVQNIDATATPTFAGVNTNSITPSGALTVGAIGQSFTLRGSAASQITANSGGFSTAVGFQAPSANTTYRFTTTTGGSYDICTTFGNCTGTGNNVAGNGTQNRIVKFTTTGSVIGDSTISDAGGVVTTSSNFVVQGGVVTIGVPNAQTGSIAFAAGASAFSGTLAQGTLTSARNYFLPDADGTVCLSSGNCLGGGGGGANTALSNLTSVAINTTLLPNAAGTINLGSAVLPFGELMIAGTSGTPATNNFKITGVSTGGLRTVTLPDASGTICLQASASCGFATGSGTAFVQGGNGFGTTATLGTTDGNDLVIVRNSATQLTVGNGNVTLASNVDLLLQGVSSYISNPQAQAGSEAFGLNASVGNTDSLAVGNGSFAGINATAIGRNSNAQGNGVAVGIGSYGDSGSTALGAGATTQGFDNSIALGRSSATTAQNQLVIGAAAPSYINSVVIGNGVTNATPIGFTLQGTSGSGSNVAGASTTIAAGQGTGSALGGSILFKSSLAGGSGSSLNSQVTLATLSTASLTTGTNIDVILQGPTAYISNTQGQSQSEAFGLNATVNSNNGVAVGYTASASNDDVAIGNNATANSYSVAIGGFSVASQAGTAVGQGASAGFNGAALGNGAGAGSWSVALGSGATTAGNTQIAIGYKAATTANHQLVIGGSTLNDSYIDTAYIGSGVSDVTPVSFTLQGTGGSGTNVAGASIAIAGGAGTGSANGGNVAIKIATPGTSGSAVNVPATVALFSGINGSALFHNSVNSTAGFQVQNAGGLALFSVDTTNNLLSILGPGTNGSNSKIKFGTDDKLSITGGNGTDNNGLNIMAYARLFVTNTNGDSSVTIDTQNGKATFNAAPGQDANGGLLVTQANTNDVFFVGTAGSEGLVKIGYVGDNNATPLILDNDATSDPTTSNGAMYYNASLNKFRCYENSTWKDCIGSASGAFVQGGNSFAAAANLGTNDNFDLNLRTNGTTRLTVKNDGSEIDLASNTDLILQGATAYISNSQASGGSEAFGLNATANGTNRSVVVGNGANINDNDSVAIGYNATGSNGSVIIGSLSSCTNNFCVSIGNGAIVSYSSVGVGGGVSVTHNEAVGIGSGAATDSFGATVIGAGASANHLQSIALGHNTHTTQDNQLVIGGPSASSDNITSVVIGSGVTDATPVGFVLQATSGAGANVSGASVTIAGGQSTGTGNGGNIAFQISNPGSSGSSLNSLTTVATFSGADGSAVFQNSTNSNTAFRVQNSAASTFLNVDTTGSGIVSVGTADTVGTLFVLDTKTDYTNHANSNSEPTGVAGGMYYNSAIGQFRCYEVDYWRDCMISARTSYDYTADMDNPDPDHQIDFSSGSGGGFGTTPGATGHPGIVQQGTGTSSSAAYAYIGSTSNNNDTILLGNGDYWRYETVMRIPTGGTLSNGTNRYTVVTGFTDNAGDAVDGCYFRYSDNINSGKWQGVCRSNSTESVCDTGTTVALNSWYRLTVTVNAAGNSTNFQINGTSLCQITTNIATGAGRQTAWASVINKSVGTADRFVEVDYITLQGQLGTAR